MANDLRCELAIICITALTAICLYRGCDVALLSGAVALIAGLAGYHLKSLVK